MEEIILTKFKHHMKSYYLVERIYDIYNRFYENDDNSIEFKRITLNLNTFDYIREINFVLLGDVDILENIKETRKIGVLLNFEVYLDPNMEDNKIIFENSENKYELKIVN